MLMSHVSTLISTYESTDMIIATGGIKPQGEEDPMQNPKNIAILKVIALCVHIYMCEHTCLCTCVCMYVCVCNM